ncbi:MAG: hypothetical protein KIT84_08550 [Labilithrix sp.]|nr:hypothetical protein [Labilithrix sp.]MCW5811048.1 hypothetical protein [Labilithrix sp.]
MGLRLAETKEVRTELAPLLPALRRVVRARLARIVAGSIGVAGAAAMTFSAAWTHDESRSPAPTLMLLASAAALVAGWVLARGGLAAGARLLRRDTTELRLTGQLDADLARIDATDPRAELHRLERRAQGLELASVGLPIAGVSFLYPLSSHWLFTQLLGGGESAGDFSQWIRVSLAIVGHAHIALAICGFLFAKRLRSLTLEGLIDLKIHREWLKAWMITIGISCLPGILLILVPPILVAITGITFIPVLWYVLHSAVVRERSKFAFAEAASNVRVAANVDVADALAEQKQREADRYDEHAGGDADDGAEREPLVVAAHRVGDDGRGR